MTNNEALGVRYTDHLGDLQRLDLDCSNGPKRIYFRLCIIVSEDGLGHFRRSL
jgi:hypothetical protein